MLSNLELGKLRKACDRLPNHDGYRCDDYVENLISVPLDFQMLGGTAERARCYFQQTHGQNKSYYYLRNLLARFPDTDKGNGALARFLWNNNHWTRAKFLRVIVKKFERLGINDQNSLRSWLEKSDFLRDIKGQFQINWPKNHSIGPAIYQWLRLRCGFDTVKPDIHICAFIEKAIGRKVTPEEAVCAMKAVAKILNRDAYKLDAAIWDLRKRRHRSVQAVCALPQGNASPSPRRKGVA